MDQNDSATPIPEGAAVEVPQVDEQQQDDQVEEGAEPAAPELTDEDYRINFLGTDKFDLPRETPEEVRASLKNLEKSLNKGWTEKNMKFSERQKEFLAAQQNEQADIAVQREMIKDLSRAEALQDAIKEYDNINWQAWAAQDPNAANQGFLNLQSLQTRLGKVKEEVTGKQRELQVKQQQSAQEFLRQAEEKLSSRIHDWGDEKRQAVGKFVTDNYLNVNPQADMRALQSLAWHPGLVEMAHDAMLYRQSLSRVTKASNPPAPKPTPVTKVGGTAPAAVNPEKMTDDEWFRWRNQDLANKRKTAHLNRGRR